MSYEICYMNSLQLLTIMFYKTEQDYIKDRPVAVYIIAHRGSKKTALEKARIAEMKYKEVEVKVLIEGKDKEQIDKLINKCLKAKEVVSPSIW